ncbi:TniQ family protein [Escherichia coli]
MWSFVPVCSGESLSSWLVRVSLFVGCDPLALTFTVWPGWRAWTRDVDRALTVSQLHALAGQSGLTELAIHRMTLSAWLGGTAGQLLTPANGAIEGVIPLGIRNRHCLSGAQFCPECLIEDARPYFRLQWRFATSIACNRHQCYLKSCCPYCGEPVQYHRLTAKDETIYRCFKCGNDLRRSRPCPVDPLALLTQNAISLIPDDPKHITVIAPRERIDAMALALFYVRFMRFVIRGHQERLRDNLRRTGLVIPDGMASPTALPIEYLTVNERARLFSAVWPLVRGGPEQFVALARRCHLSSNGLQDFRPPAFLKTLLADLPSNPVPHSRRHHSAHQAAYSRSVIVRRWALFLRRTAAARNG